jgi:N-acetylmuramic acid 6-phosphate etherase
MALPTEASDPRFQELDTWPLETSLEALIASNLRGLEAVRQALPQLTLAARGLERCLAAGGRLVYAGAGTSGRLALQDAAELPPTFGFESVLVLLAGGDGAEGRAKEGAEDDEEAAVAAVDEAQVSAADAVVGIAASGGTPYTVAAVRRARERGAFTVGIANNRGTPLLMAAEVGIFLGSGPEVLAGSTRLAAGTAQKVALNALSTSVLVRLGGAYGNLMVGMRPVNEKLRLRATHIVSAATGEAESVARQALERCGWHVREAIVTLEAGLSSEAARKLLQRHGQRVREALEEAKLEARRNRDPL